jgi:hypothetical protein
MIDLYEQQCQKRLGREALANAALVNDHLAVRL